MKLFLDCIPCFQKQVLFTVKDLDDKLKSKILRKVMILLCDTSWELTPDEIANKAYNLIREETGIADPYKQIKKQSNKMAMELYPKLKTEMKSIRQKDRLYIAANLAIAGNIIDYGPAFEFDLGKTIKEVLNKKPAINDFDILTDKVMSAESLLYFADNAGEIALDKMFIQEMITIRGKPFNHISFVVKGGPIINDAMIEDAYEVGIDKLPNVVFYKIGNGQEGTGPNRWEDVVKEWIKEHDLVISKGQGNFEGLSENSNIFFMLIAKCPVIAKEIGVNVKDTVIKYN
ncbi:MAG TPA: ARMT1-like domain-containing protein [Tepidanaerobacteraceae bacterium]|nr:ARMT1-like domain-containing protein [Tepidanaerobacteraceae bacterium]